METQKEHQTLLWNISMYAIVRFFEITESIIEGMVTEKKTGQTFYFM